MSNLFSLKIDFPFGTVNDEECFLTLYVSKKTDFTSEMAIMDADSRSFTHLSDQTVSMTGGTNTIHWYRGTLAGDVISEDDDREDVFVPLVESKLKFNMVCKEFPSWLMGLCDYYTNVKVLLCAVNGNVASERWRGYLMANTLNMTVVDDMMACPLVAVDEIGIAKYLKFRENYTNKNESPTLFELFEEYWVMNTQSDHPNNSKFDDLYDLVGAGMQTGLFFARDMKYYDSSNVEQRDMMALTINLERYFVDRDANWSDVFSDICSYLGVTFCIGGHEATGCDNYILSDANYNWSEYLLYTFGQSGYIRIQSRAFADLGNQSKIGADFQATYKPCEWKGVRVISTPERPPIHVYLENDNIQALPAQSGHDEWCETRIGKKNDSSQTLIDDYKYRVFQYAKIVDKKEQWIAEDKYVHLELTELSDEGYYLASQGYFPYDGGGLAPGLNTIITDSLDFAMIRRGMIAAKLGSYETPRQKVSADLRNYYVILNNHWGRLYWDDDTAVSEVVVNEWLMASFMPFADDVSIRPSNESFLTIDITAMFLNENIGDDIRIVKNGALEDDLHGEIQSIFPITESYWNWDNGNGHDCYFTGNLEATEYNHVVNFAPVIKVRLSIGNHYWDGSQWVYEENVANAPKFWLSFVPTGATNKYWIVSTGYMHGSVQNYYYEECKSKLGASDNLFRVPLGGLSVHGQPLQGKVKLEVFGPVPFVNGYKEGLSSRVIYNNVLFVLLSDVRFEFTDEALLNNKDIGVKAEKMVDAGSTTKKVKEVELNMSTPSVDGVFNNCLLYDNGKSWVNLTEVHDSGSNGTPEEFKSIEMAAVLGNEQLFVEFSRPFVATATDNIYNVGFTVSGLTEASGHFMPLTRKFNWTKGWVRWKMQKVD